MLRDGGIRLAIVLRPLEIVDGRSATYVAPVPLNAPTAGYESVALVLFTPVPPAVQQGYAVVTLKFSDGAPAYFAAAVVPRAQLHFAARFRPTGRRLLQRSARWFLVAPPFVGLLLNPS
ncbi:MAG: hypothetical protein R3C10_11925 [Pirellulales bacterium]